MAGNTSSQSRSAVAGIAVFISGAVTAFIGTLQGARFAHSQLVNPLISPLGRPVGVGGAVVGSLLGMAILLVITLELVDSLGTPRVAGRTEFTLVGSGGLCGTAGATGISLLAWTNTVEFSSSVVPAETGESLIALAAIALPTAYAYYHFWRPNPVTPSRSAKTQSPDPEFIRQEREQWSEPEGSYTQPASPTPAAPSPKQESDGTDETSGPVQSEETGVDMDDMEYDWITETDVSFDDVGGMEELKTQLETEVVKPLTTGRDKADALDIPLPNIVFHGPPGTGKTYIAQALATELGLPFAKLSGADVQSKWINESAQKINTLFTEAEAVAEHEGGAVVFLDELDSVLKSRNDSGSAHEEDTKVVNEFLNHLQNTGENDIVFIGATNRLDAIDEAGMRSGRIDKKIHVGKPDARAREKILRAQLSDRANTLSDEQVQFLAQETEGLVAADLESIIVSAARHSAFRRDDDVIKWGDMQAAVGDWNP